MTAERWATFEKRIQLLNIGAEFERARVWEEKGDMVEVQNALARAMELIKLSLLDPKWKNEIDQLHALRTMVMEFVSGAHKGEAALLYQVL